MKTGNISQTVWKRSILTQLHNVQDEVLFSPSMKEVYTDAVVFGKARDVGSFAVARVLNDLAIRGVSSVRVSLQILLTPSVSETGLKEMIGYMETVCRTAGAQITRVKAEISPCITYPVVFACGAGSVQEENEACASRAVPGQDIVLCGYAGLEGTLRILSERKEELGRRFVPAFLRQMKELQNQMPAADAIAAARHAGAAFMHQVGGGGIFAGLWELAEASGVGLEVDRTKMPVKQEIIEVCEYYGLNPYQMTSAGCVLMTADDGDALVKVLEGVGARAAKLGVATEKNARVIASGEEKRYLDRPAPDELMLWWERGGKPRPR